MTHPPETAFYQLTLCMGIPLRVRSAYMTRVISLALREFECSRSFAISKQINNFDNSLSHPAIGPLGLLNKSLSTRTHTALAGLPQHASDTST